MPRPLSRAVTDIAGLADIAPGWWDLWQRCPAATPFQTPAWLLAWWKHFSPGPLRSSVVVRDGQLEGLAAFYLEEASARLLPVGISLSDYLDVLIAPADIEASAALNEPILATDWQSWEFEDLGPGAAALGLSCPAGYLDTVADQHACPVLDLVGPPDLTGCVPARRRRQLRRARAFAERRGKTEIRRIGRDTTAFLDGLFALHTSRWATVGEPGLVAAERVRRFHHEALRGLAAADLSRCYELLIDERLVGAYYGFLERGRAYAYMGGFDPDFAAESPGAILIGHAIEEAMREGAKEFRFLRGREDYKYSWGATDRWNRRRTWRRAGIGG